MKFVGSSKKDSSAFPELVKQDVGHALFMPQEGDRSPTGKTLQGLGGGSVVEIAEDHDGETYRGVYTTKVSDVIVVLHEFQKKSKQGRETPKLDVDLIHTRLRSALKREWN